jgi:hypothetical protein
VVDFEHVSHPRVEERLQTGPVKTADVATADATKAVSRFNAWLALSITRVVGTMWCAYAFVALDLVSLPASLKGGTLTTVQWIAQTFLQLVLLSIIMVGQNIQAKSSDERSRHLYDDVDAILHEIHEVHRHLDAQDAAQAPGGSLNR